MDAKTWFILHEGQVLGPFSLSETQAKISGLKNIQIWGRGMSEWLTPEKWEKNLKKFPQYQAQTDAPEVWKLRVEGKEHPALPYQQLLSYLKGLKDLNAVDVCLENENRWQDVYSVPSIINELGITRRSHPRVPIMGDLECESPKGSFKLKVISISEGGLGVSGPERLTLGERFKGLLTSDNLFASFNSTLEVVYSGKDGYAGLRFVVISDEAKNSIIEYVKKFT